MLRRDEPDSKNPGISQPRLWRTDKLPRSLQQVYESFCNENLIEIPAMDRLAVVGFRLYQLPEGMPRLNGLRVIHPGWWLGTFKKDRFEPAHALALSLKTSNCGHLLSLPADSPELLAYLRCENLNLDSIDQYWSGGKKDGWVIVAVQPHNLNASPQTRDINAFPLGWGKRVHSILKNHYPRGLQWK
jgi:NOL1/NOP2/fmu family ribosome biogenesis protein